MPLIGNAGFSDNTPYKQEQFRTIMRTLCKIVQQIMRKPYAHAMETFLYVDLRAGYGWYREGETLFDAGTAGSPLIALRCARELALPFQGYLIEHHEPTARALTGNLVTHGGLTLARREADSALFVDSHGPYQYDLFVGESERYTPRILDMLAQVKGTRDQEIYGVIYCDENGGLPPFDELEAYSRLLPKTDLIIHLSATHRKRWQYRPGAHPPSPLIEALSAVKKDCWIIRTPHYREQWTFLIGSNWDQFPRFEKQGFFRHDSHEGRKIMAQLSYRREDFL